MGESQMEFARMRRLTIGAPISLEDELILMVIAPDSVKEKIFISRDCFVSTCIRVNCCINTWIGINGIAKVNCLNLYAAN